MNTAVQNQTAPAPAAPVAAAQSTPPSFAAELGGAIEGAGDGAIDAGGPTVTDEMLDSLIGGDIEEGPEVKTTNNFTVRFRKASDSKKKIKGSLKALETLVSFGFVRLAPGVIVAEDAPKKRGRKPKVQANALGGENARPNMIRMKFYDCTDNAAVDFVEALHSREDFTVDLGILGDEGEVETFTFDGCNVVPMTVYEEFVRNEDMGKAKELALVLSFKEQTRTSAGAEQETDE